MLEEESGIDEAIVEERGYYTARNTSEVLPVFSKGQRRIRLVLPMFSPDGETNNYQLRPDKPRKPKKGKPAKYMTPKGSSSILDVHPRNMGKVGDPSVDLWITEGVKKGDALTSHGLCAVALVGVWNWQRSGELLPCWEHVALQGREVFVVFDSDVMVKPQRYSRP